MSLNINGGTEKVWWDIEAAQPNMGTISFWIRTTQAVTNVVPLSYWSATSRNGWGFILTNTGQTGFIAYASSAQRLNLSSTTAVNTGADFHICARYGRFSGNGCQLFINGSLENNAAASGSWASAGQHFFLQAGDQVDTFWPSFIGEIWDVAHWANTATVLSDDEVVALSKGISPLLIRPSELLSYSPLITNAKDLKGNVINSQTTTTYTPHGRRLGPGQ